MNTKVLLLTNGRSFSNYDFFKETIKRLPNMFRVAIPVHGSNAEQHDAITRAPGSFMQTKRGIQRFLNTNTDVEIRIVVTKWNADNLLSIAKLIVADFPNVKCVNFIGLEPRGNCARDLDSVFIDYSSSFQKSKKAINFLVKSGFDVGLYNYPLCNIDMQYWNLAVKSISHYKNVFLPKCNECIVKDICAGFFTAATRIAEPKVKPVKKVGEYND